MPWTIDRLSLEVTRKCNLQCEHCMRGGTQNLSMTEEVVNSLLKNVDRISSVTFTGGEPTLNVPIILYFVQMCLWRGINIGTFYLVTNGLKYSQELVDCLYGIYNRSYEDELCGLCVSRDYFHELSTSKKKQGFTRFANNYEKYEELPFYRTDKEYFFQFGNTRNGSVDYDRLIAMGRAENLVGCGAEICAKCDKRPRYEEDSYTKRISDGEFYVSANGDVCLCPDLSYKMQKKMKIGNVLTDDFNSMIWSNLEKQEWA